MSYLCETHGCAEYATHRYTWPGKDESFICAMHKPKLCAVADAIGLRLQCILLIPPGADAPSRQG